MTHLHTYPSRSLRESTGASQAEEEEGCSIRARHCTKEGSDRVYGGQATADHLIKNDGEKEDSDIPVDTVALAMLDRATHGIAVYSKATKAADHTIEAYQHFAGKKDRIASFY